jgi:hypothetical protein
MGNIAPAGTKGSFFFTLAPGARTVQIQLSTGDAQLTAPLQKLEGKIAASVIFPEGAPQKLIREGFVMCSSYSKACDLVFAISDMPPNRTVAWGGVQQ